MPKKKSIKILAQIGLQRKVIQKSLKAEKKTVFTCKKLIVKLVASLVNS